MRTDTGTDTHTQTQTQTQTETDTQTQRTNLYIVSYVIIHNTPTVICSLPPTKQAFANAATKVVMHLTQAPFSLGVSHTNDWCKGTIMYPCTTSTPLKISKAVGGWEIFRSG